VAEPWQPVCGHLRTHRVLNRPRPTAFAATLEGESVEAVSAATLAGRPVGAPPLPPAQPANHHPILL